MLKNSCKLTQKCSILFNRYPQALNAERSIYHFGRILFGYTGGDQAGLS